MLARILRRSRLAILCLALSLCGLSVLFSLPVPVVPNATSVALGASPPAVAIVSPGTGETVKGTVRIVASATAGSGEYPTGISFYDGVNGIGHVECQNQPSCTGSVEWHATGLSGQHELTARVETNEGMSATSAPVLVTVVSPSPTVAITSPGAGATVEGTVIIKAEAATDPSQEDYPAEISLYDGANGIGNISCQGQRVCQGQVEWHATDLTGPHTLTAKVSTNRNLSVVSAPLGISVVSPPPQVAITHPGDWAPLRGTILVTVSGSTAPKLEEYPTEIAVYNGTSEIGSVSCQGQQTCGGVVPWNTSGLKGTHTLKAVIHTNRNRESTSGPIYVGGHPRKPHAHVSCQIHSFHIRAGRYDHGNCTLSNVPAGTAVVVQYRSAGANWRSIGATLVHLRASAHYEFNVRNRSPITFQVSVLVSANSRYAATRVLLGTVHIT